MIMSINVTIILCSKNLMMLWADPQKERLSPLKLSSIPGNKRRGIGNKSHFLFILCIGILLSKFDKLVSFKILSLPMLE